MKTNNAAVLALGIATLALAGCHAEDRPAPKAGVQAVQLQSYPLGEQTLQNNKFFLWKDGVTPSTVAQIIHTADQIDLNDDAGVAVQADLTQAVADLGTANDAFNAAIQSLDDASKDKFNNWHDLVDEKVTLYTDAEYQDYITKAEGDLRDAKAKLDGVEAGLDSALAAKIGQLYNLGMAHAHLGQADPNRGTLQKQIDDMNKALPTLPKTVLSAKTAVDSLFVTYEGYFRDRARRAELDGLIPDAEKSLPALTGDMQKARAALVAAFARKEDLFQKQYRIGRDGETLVGFVIRNTHYYEDMPERVTFKDRNGVPAITIVGWPEKDVTLSTDDGTIRNASYESVGGVIRFEAYPNGTDQNYFKFRLSRTRPEIRDDRVFYQGDMDLCVADTPCVAKDNQVISHGVAKLTTRK